MTSAEFWHFLIAPLFLVKPILFVREFGTFLDRLPLFGRQIWKPPYITARFLSQARIYAPRRDSSPHLGDSVVRGVTQVKIRIASTSLTTRL